MGILFTLITLTVIICSSPEELMTTMQMAMYWGYPIEAHVVVSSDGYILKIFRIPGHQRENLEDAKAKRKPPVVLQHGLICSSDQYLDGGAYSLAYELADQGYDVWIPNIRGNRYSRDHLYYDSDDNKYWDYTFEDMALKDQKSYWEYIMKQTGYDKLAFVAHSQGTTQMFIAMIYDPEYYEKHLSVFIAHSPVTDISHTTSTVLASAAKVDLPKRLDEMGIHTLLPYKTSMASVISKLCFIAPFICNYGVQMIADEEPNYDNQERMTIFLSHYPSGSSSKNYEHIMQLASYGFVRYRTKNNSPKEFYDLNKVPKSIKIAVMTGKADKLADLFDSRALRDNLTNLGLLNFYREYDHMGHLTFLIPSEHTMDFVKDTVTFLRDYYMPGLKQQ